MAFRGCAWRRLNNSSFVLAGGLPVLVHVGGFLHLGRVSNYQGAGKEGKSSLCIFEHHWQIPPSLDRHKKEHIQATPCENIFARNSPYSFENGQDPSREHRHVTLVIGKRDIH